MFDELDREVFVAGEQIFKLGDAGDCAYIIESGSVEIFVIDQGMERLISSMGKGEMFGEIALIDHKPRTATVRAAEKTALIPVSRKLVEGLLQKADPVLRHLLLVTLERFRNNQSGAEKSVADTGASSVQSDQRISLEGEATQKLVLVHGMKRALTHEEFELHYQPIINLSDGHVAGFEALIRWNHPVDGLVSPNDFLWLAEQTDLIHELGLWTLERACRDWETLKRHTRYPFPFVSVNLSPNQLTSDTLVDDIKSVIARHKMPPAELKLELTETVMVENPEKGLSILNKLVELGSSLALDDYGTGHSGLNHLMQYPIKTLKIDRAFVDPMLKSAHSMHIVRSSIDLAHSLGMNVVAEGVETEAMRDKLLELGCDFGQGWCFGRPVALQNMTAQAR